MMKNSVIRYMPLIVALGMSISLCGFWADPKFPEKLIQRYPSYKGKITSINNEIINAWKLVVKDSKNEAAKTILTEKSKQLADLVCEAARREIKDQITEESEFVIIKAD